MKNIRYYVFFALDLLKGGKGINFTKNDAISSNNKVQKKVLVLCGGIPQVELIKQLKGRGYFVVLADRNPGCEGAKYADIFFPISALDVDGVQKLAQEQSVEFIITVCADQVLEVMAIVSENLGLPCYIGAKTATFDVVKAAIDLSEGNEPVAKVVHHKNLHIVNEFIYCNPGILDHLEGFEEAKKRKYITEYFQLKQCGTEVGNMCSSGDRVAYCTMEAKTVKELGRKHKKAAKILKVIDDCNNDILKHELLDTFKVE